MIERLRLSASAKVQLANLKRKTGIEHNNTLCRHALCLSLANPTRPPIENYNFNGGLEIDWRTFTGGHEVLYLNLILVRLLSDDLPTDIETVRQMLSRHVHRGLSYLVSRTDDDLTIELSKDVIAAGSVDN